VLEQSAWGRLEEANLEFVDLNHDDVFTQGNRRARPPPEAPSADFPEACRPGRVAAEDEDSPWRRHAAMKNLFGVMPAWPTLPKNVLHHAGIPARSRHQRRREAGLAIVDGIVAWKGRADHGHPRASGVLVMARTSRASTLPPRD